MTLSTESIEEIASQLQQLEPCQELSRHALSLLASRLHVARGPAGTIEFFIEGPRESFGNAAVGKSLEWGTYRDAASDRTFEALVVRTTESGSTLRLMAHLAYEAMQLLRTRPRLSNSELLICLTPFVSLVTQRTILSTQQQLGLAGEMLLLYELLNFAESRDPPADPRLALSAWQGWDSASRDFVGRGVAVEVKSTGADSRRHQVHPMQQVLPDARNPGERVYVYSVGLRPDRSSGFRLITMFDRVANKLAGDALDTLLERVRRYGGSGFDPDLRRHYELETGFVITLPAAFFRVDDADGILRPSSFVDGEPPARVKQIRYELLLEGIRPVAAEERADVLSAILATP